MKNARKTPTKRRRTPEENAAFDRYFLERYDSMKANGLRIFPMLNENGTKARIVDIEGNGDPATVYFSEPVRSKFELRVRAACLFALFETDPVRAFPNPFVIPADLEAVVRELLLSRKGDDFRISDELDYLKGTRR